MGIISLIVHTWGGVDKSKAVCPQRGPCMLTRRLMLVCTLLGFWCLALTILLCFGVIEINAIFVQLCGLSPIYVATHEPGRNIHIQCVNLSSRSFGPFVVETR